MAVYDAVREQTVSEDDHDLAELRGRSARMAPHWTAPMRSAPAPVPPSLIHGVVVSPASARLVDGIGAYGV
ncbi:hypothetical protein [Streptomyces sp. ODS05-4]|uniref:hypothetical protein n=1 Tax=Streptomyces sp. ODS05-4 TaxID=2944939 RepID=UPI002109305E|nr:hypothetical protein [Streptomyces sp. ODS05-4]